MAQPARTWGRMYDELGNYKWVSVLPDTSGNLDAIYLTTLVQVLRLNENESPFFRNYGIPAANSVIQQVAPDYAAARTQRQFQGFFASLIVGRAPVPFPSPPRPVPTYNVRVLTHQGVLIQAPYPPTGQVPIPI